MRVYVESNFVLEWVLEQPQAPGCEGLLGLAERGAIRLATPALALFEPYYKLTGDRSRRSAIRREVEQHIGQIARTSALATAAHDAREALDLLLIRSSAEALARFATFRRRLLDIADILPMDGMAFSAATDPVASTLEYPDALVLGAVVADLEARRTLAEQSCFLNSNKKDFDDPGIRERLESLGCRSIYQFASGFEYVSSQIRRPDEA